MSPPKPRQFSPPCWTDDEARALISAYKHRLSALRQSNLKAADWDPVSSAVARQFPLVSPPKTAQQCRQKMEKLRRRYRSEKDRASAASSWDLFLPMSDLECQCPSAFGSRVGVQFGGGFRVRKDESYKFLGDDGDDLDPILSDPDVGGRVRVEACKCGENSRVLGGGSSLNLLRSSRAKMGDDPMGEMASSVEYLGEVFVKMEKRKMAMARDIAKMRMEMEMKQHQVIMESQKQTLNACVDALLESKKRAKKKKKIQMVEVDDS